jgi:CRP-like cAMP-binding protein
MEIMGVTDQLTKDTFFLDTDMALEWAEDHLLKVELPAQNSFSEFDLAGVGLFKNFTHDELKAVQAILVHEVYGKGDPVFMEKDDSRDLYILIQGLMTVAIYLPDRGRNKRLFTYSSGISFGEISFLDASPRSASVWAYENSEVFRLPFSDFERLRKKNPEIAHKLFKNIALEISYYLRRSSKQIRELEDDN